MTEQQTKELFNIHIVTNDARTIFASGRDFLEAFEKGAAIEGAFLVTAYWFHREIPVWIAALDQLYADYEFHYGQRVDLAIEYLRAQGVQCPEFTNYLLRQSRYGTAPAGQEELARLQSGIAAIRADLINRRNVMVHRFRSVAAHQGAYMLPGMAVIEDVLRALGALVPEEAEQCCQGEQNDH